MEYISAFYNFGLLRFYPKSRLYRLGIWVGAGACATGAVIFLLRKLPSQVVWFAKHVWYTLRSALDLRGTRVTTANDQLAGAIVSSYLDHDSCEPCPSENENSLTTDPSSPDIGQSLESPRRLRVNTTFNLAHEARSRFYLESRTRANYMVVRRYIYDRMVELGMRPSHIARQLPIAVSLAFTLNQGDLDDQIFRTSNAYVEHNRPRRYFYWWWGILPSYREALDYDVDV